MPIWKKKKIIVNSRERYVQADAEKKTSLDISSNTKTIEKSNGPNKRILKGSLSIRNIMIDLLADNPILIQIWVFYLTIKIKNRHKKSKFKSKRIGLWNFFKSTKGGGSG